MVYAFMQLNPAKIKANYPMKRLEPILRKSSAPWLSHYFKTDAPNEYWEMGISAPHAYSGALYFHRNPQSQENMKVAMRELLSGSWL